MFDENSVKIKKNSVKTKPDGGAGAGGGAGVESGRGSTGGPPRVPQRSLPAGRVDSTGSRLCLGTNKKNSVKLGNPG